MCEVHKTPEEIEANRKTHKQAAVVDAALCVKRHQPLDAADLQEPKPNGMCSGCYYGALGDEIERHPIGNPCHRALNKTMPTDLQLKRALVKLLPRHLIVEGYRLIELSNSGQRIHNVSDRELLGWCWQVEETLTGAEHKANMEIQHQMWIEDGCPSDASSWKYHKSWRQRVISASIIKGIEL